MANEADMEKFLAEFETLKAKYGEAFAELKVARLTVHKKIEGTAVQGWQDYEPQVCTVEDVFGDGMIIEIVCEDVRK